MAQMGALGLRELLRQLPQETVPGTAVGFQEPLREAMAPEDQIVPEGLLASLLAAQQPARTVPGLESSPYSLRSLARPMDYSLAGIAGVNLGGAGRGGGGGGGGGAGVSGFSPGAGANARTAREIARWIESRPGNFQVSGLEGFQGTGQISSGHVTNSQHYTGEAGDVSYTGGGRWRGEPAALDWLYRRLQQRYGSDLTELLWRVKDHYDHLHYGVRPGG